MDTDLPTAQVRMSTASERAASTCALGADVAGRLQADCIRAVRSWCRLGYGDHIVVHVEHQQLASISTPGLLTSAAATFTGPDGRRHAAIAVTVGVRAPAVHLPYTSIAAADVAPPPQSSPWAAPFAAVPPSPGARASASAAGPAGLGSAAPSLDPLPGLALHWGCSGGPGHRWSGPGAGWHTLPAVSYDAGRGAWQTPMAVRQAVPLEGLHTEPVGGGGVGQPQQQWAAVYSLVLQLPWEGAIRDGGVCFVLKTARNQWIKARPAPPPPPPTNGNHSNRSNGGNGDGDTAAECDFWIPTSGLSLVGGGAVQLPDVFRMTHSDSLPMVAQTQTHTHAAASNGSVATDHGDHQSSSDAASNGSSATTAAHTPSVTDADLLGAAATFLAPPRPSDGLLRPADRHPLPLPRPGQSQGVGVCRWMVDQIAQREPQAERSLMHRYHAAADLVEMAAGSGELEGALAAVTAWLRLSSARLLVWNRNYNVKPREISTAQERVAASLAALGHARGPAPSSATPANGCWCAWRWRRWGAAGRGRWGSAFGTRYWRCSSATGARAA